MSDLRLGYVYFKKQKINLLKKKKMVYVRLIGNLDIGPESRLYYKIMLLKLITSNFNPDCSFMVKLSYYQIKVGCMGV